jgi:two-component system, NtrC family, nitrogen regulation response regulator GlnG
MAPADKTILIVEDDTWLRGLLHRALENAGYRVVVTGNAYAARREIRETRLDLMVTDLHLPDGNGLDLVADAQRVTPLLPVLVMSAGLRSHDEALRQAIDSVGANRLLEKPFSLALLLDAVRQSLGLPG